MRFNKASLLFSLVCPASLLMGGAAQAQQASFAVAVTLHAVAKPMSAAQLCPRAGSVEMAGAVVRVECPTVTSATSSSTAKHEASASHRQRPEVTVTF